MFDVTVTFDNGPEPSVTPRVLDVLARRGVRTTFFVIGNKLLTRDARACTERAHAEGHWIGNHTWTHSRPLGERPGAATADPGDRAHAGRDRRSVALRPTVPTHRWRRPPGPPAAESGRGGAAQGRRATPACCGTRSRATGRTRRAGSGPRLRNSRGNTGR